MRDYERTTLPFRHECRNLRPNYWDPNSSAMPTTNDDSLECRNRIAEARKASNRHATAMGDAARVFNVRPATEANVHARAQAQECARTVIELTKLGWSQSI